MKRRSLAICVLMAAGLLIGGLLPARAFEREGTVIHEDETVVMEYPGIAGNDPATVTLGTHPTPDDCKTGGAFAGSCDVYPIEIVVPDSFDPEVDEYFISFSFSWPDENTDHDFLIYDNAQGDEENEVEEGTYYEETSAASSGNPEVARLRNPTKGNYNVVAINFAGAPSPITMEVVWKASDFSQPFEFLGPPAGGQSEPPESTKTTVTTQLSEGPPAAAPVRSTTTTTLAVAPVEESDAFAGIDLEEEEEGFEAGLAAPVDAGGLLDAEGTPSKPPSSLTVILTFIALPIAAAAAAAVWLLRRRTALRFS